MKMREGWYKHPKYGYGYHDGTDDPLFPEYVRFLFPKEEKYIYLKDSDVIEASDWHAPNGIAEGEMYAWLHSECERDWIGVVTKVTPYTVEVTFDYSIELYNYERRDFELGEETETYTFGELNYCDDTVDNLVRASVCESCGQYDRDDHMMSPMEYSDAAMSGEDTYMVCEGCMGSDYYADMQLEYVGDDNGHWYNTTYSCSDYPEGMVDRYVQDAYDDDDYMNDWYVEEEKSLLDSIWCRVEKFKWESRMTTWDKVKHKHWEYKLGRKLRWLDNVIFCLIVVWYTARQFNWKRHVTWTFRKKPDWFWWTNTLPFFKREDYRSVASRLLTHRQREKYRKYDRTLQRDAARDGRIDEYLDKPYLWDNVRFGFTLIKDTNNDVISVHETEVPLLVAFGVAFMDMDLQPLCDKLGTTPEDVYDKIRNHTLYQCKLIKRGYDVIIED